MRPNYFRTLFVVLAVCVAVPLQAQDAEEKRSEGKSETVVKRLLVFLDANEDGKLELQTELKSKLPPKGVFPGYIKADTDKNGYLDGKELLSFANGVPERFARALDQWTLENTLALWKRAIDGNQDGQIEKKEIEQSQAPAVVKEALHGGDTNKDGVLDKKEQIAAAKEIGKTIAARFTGDGPGWGDLESRPDRLPGRSAMRAIPSQTTDYDVERLLEQDDRNKDGKIGKGDGRIRLLLSRNFDDFDTNSDGFLDKAELKKTNFRPYSGKLFLEAYDKDGDGVLAKAEAGHRTLARDFEKLDTDGSGTLSEAEMDRMRGGMRFGGGRGAAQGGFRGGAPGGGFGERRNPVEAAMAFDTNEDGKVSKEEAKELVRELFDILDTDKDGFANRAELQANSRMLSMGRLADFILQRADTDGDGKVSKEEAMKLPERSPFRARFDQSDADKDGYLSKLEFIQEFARLGDGAFGGGSGRGGSAGRRNPATVEMESDANKDGKISKDEASELVKELFDTLDADKDGAVSQAELRANTRMLTVGRFADRAVQTADTDGDGKIAKAEAQELGDRNPIRDRFDELDADKDGFVTKVEFIQVLGRPRVQTGSGRLGGFAGFLLRRGDSDDDGKISKEEFDNLPGNTARRLGRFDDLDANNDGYLETDELGSALERNRNSGPTRGRRLIGIRIGDSDESGVKIAAVTDGGRAAKAGIKADDHILSINGDTVDDVESLRDAVNSGEPTLKIRISRDGEEHEVEINSNRVPQAFPNSQTTYHPIAAAEQSVAAFF